MHSPLQARQQGGQSWRKKVLVGSASVTALCLISAYLYYSRSFTGLSCQQSVNAGSHAHFGLNEQNRLIEAIYQVRSDVPARLHMNWSVLMVYTLPVFNVACNPH